MDRESIEAIARVAALRESNTDERYLSESVRARVAELDALSDEQVEELYRDSFERAKQLASILTSDRRYDASREEIDLSEFGLGVVHLRVSEDEDEGAGIKPHTSIKLDVSSFQQSEYGGDPPVIWLNDDGKVEPFRFITIRAEALEVLDFLETLQVLTQPLLRRA